MREFLETPLGLEMAHALILLVIAVAGYLTYLTRSETRAVSSKLDEHIRQTRLR